MSWSRCGWDFLCPAREVRGGIKNTGFSIFFHSFFLSFKFFLALLEYLYQLLSRRSKNIQEILRVAVSYTDSSSVWFDKMPRRKSVGTPPHWVPRI